MTIAINCKAILKRINLFEYFLLKSPFDSIDTKPVTSTIKSRKSAIPINIGAIFVKNSIN